MENGLLQLEDYAGEIALGKLYLPVQPEHESKRALVDSLLGDLGQKVDPGGDYTEKRKLLNGLINTLQPRSLGPESVVKLDILLQLELQNKIITDAGILARESKLNVGNTRIFVWQGDITTLKVDAIVNAANSSLLGCFEANHKCIDNAIHSAAGVQLRDDCDRIMQKQGRPEPNGIAKITRAYNLPSRFVLHTVGPMINGDVSEKDRLELSSAYTSCLDLSKETKKIRSIAFCGISTGVFGYPSDKAAELALLTVSTWLDQNPNSFDLVVFNVFSDKDREIYDALLKG